MAFLAELFGDNFLSEDGLVPTSELEGKLVGLYFSCYLYISNYL